jgi:hypothetical protein
VIVEMREYTLHAGAVPEYLELHERERLAIQREILGHLVGCYATEAGAATNQVVHLWAYESFEEGAAPGGDWPSTRAGSPTWRR